MDTYIVKDHTGQTYLRTSGDILRYINSYDLVYWTGGVDTSDLDIGYIYHENGDEMEIVDRA